MQSDGMQVIEKHGGGSHFMRPDRVYRTGVLSPSMNYAPGQDVQAVAAEFTERSMDLSGSRRMNISCCDNCSCGGGDPCCSDMRSKSSRYAFAGLFGPTAKVGFMERLRLRFDAWRTRMGAKSAQKAQAVQAAAWARQDAAPFEERASAFFANPRSRGMAYAQVGSQVAPAMMGQVRMLAQLTSGSMPAHVADAQVATSMERWNNLRWNG
jgi:hypothetical protein